VLGQESGTDSSNKLAGNLLDCGLAAAVNRQALDED